MTQPQWPERLTRVIAQEVRRYRTERGLSAQQLADRCAELQMPIQRSVLANLENGRREAISMAELLILARALEVPPTLLLFPLGRQAAVEISPGQELPTWEAASWFWGTARIEDTEAGFQVTTPDGDDIVALFLTHDSELYDLQMVGPQELRHPDGRVAKTAEEIRQEVATALGEHRAHMRKLGITPPDLPAELAYVDDVPRRRPRPRKA